MMASANGGKKPGQVKRKKCYKDNKRFKEIASMSVLDYIVYGRSHMDVIIIKCTINSYNTIRIPWNAILLVNRPIHKRKTNTGKSCTR